MLNRYFLLANIGAFLIAYCVTPCTLESKGINSERWKKRV